MSQARPPGERWEYQLLHVWRSERMVASSTAPASPMSKKWQYVWQLQTAVATTELYRGFGQEDEPLPTSPALLNHYGDEGWELVGTPLQANDVFSVGGVNTAKWVGLTYYMKRSR